MAGRLADQISLDLLVFDARGLSESAAADCATEIALAAAGHGCRTVALLDTAMIDAVAGPMLAAEATLLCDPRPAETAEIFRHPQAA